MAGRDEQGSSPFDSMMVNVWFRSQQTSYQLHPQSTVAQLRQQLAQDHSVPPPEMKILLGGHLLEDELTIQASGVGLESTLFAIQRRSPPPTTTTTTTRPDEIAPTPRATTASTATPTSTTQTTTTPSAVCPISRVLTAQTADALAACPPVDKYEYMKNLKDQYYVYCKLCQEIRVGRLRVKCSVCEGGAVLLDKGPGSWEDVLTPGRLTGSCQSLHCEDCTPIFYFKCAEPHAGDVSGTAVALHHIAPNRRGVLCITCEDILSPVVVFPCLLWCHVMCVGCFITYCSVQLKERRFLHSAVYGYTLPCPAGCTDSLIQEQHHFCVLGPAEYNRYKDFAAEECVLAEGGIYCPHDTCGVLFLSDARGSCVICPHCQYVFCRNCRQAAHVGECSTLPSTPKIPQFSDAVRAERARWERATADTIQQITKACPGCRTRTERDGGCMHMRCARCGEEWCWLCVKTWDRNCQGAHWFG